MSYLQPVLRFIIRYGLRFSCLILLLITIGSLIRVQEAPTQNNIDKVIHFLAYMGLVLPISLSYHPRTSIVFCFATIWGGMIEIIQPYFGREADYLDAFANMLGALAGIYLAALILKTLYIAPSPFDE